MLVTAGPAESNGINYRTAAGGGVVGSLGAGSDAELQTGQNVTRIATMFDGNSGSIRIWDNPSTQAFSSLFPTTTDYALRFQTADAGPFTLTRGRQTANNSLWTTTSTPAQAAIDAVAEDDVYIIAIARTSTTVVTEFDADGSTVAWLINVPSATGFAGTPLVVTGVEMYERFGGTYVQVQVYERGGGTYGLINLYERTNGIYVD